MKKLLFLLVCFFSLGVMAQDVLPKPNPPRLVTDAAHVLSPEQVDILEQKLVALDDSSSNQIAVVLVKSLGDYGIEEYAVKLFREWGIGNKKTNNGVLLIAAIDDRKVRIEVGYGLEGAIPDVIASSIIRNDIAPNFKEQNYYRGIDNAINSLSKAAVGEYKVKKAKKGNNGSGGGSILGFILIVIVVIILAIIRGSRGGGPRGGMTSRNGFGDIATGMLLGSLLNSGNRGGGWGGGGWSGGGGGGFGGFGGGSSGGGGASGGW